MNPNEQAAEAAAAAGVTVRPLRDRPDAGRALELLRATWGDEEVFPAELVLAMEVSGDLVLGAFDDAGLAGFTLGFYADGGGMHLHSHMLAVRPDAQRRGIGYALKLAQRRASLAAGITTMRWTFDPLQTRNAAFNLNKLGAVADAFARDFYGTMDDAQSFGDRGDRLWARWDLDAPSQRPTLPDARRVEVPSDYWEVRAQDRPAAQAIRDTVADALEAAFAAGGEAVAFRDGGYEFA